MEIASKEFVDDNSGRKYYYAGYTSATDTWTPAGRDFGPTALQLMLTQPFFGAMRVWLPEGKYVFDGYIIPYIELEGFSYTPTKEKPLYLCQGTSPTAAGNIISPLFYCKMESNIVKNPYFTCAWEYYKEGNIISDGEWMLTIGTDSSNLSAEYGTCLCEETETEGKFKVLQSINSMSPSTTKPWVKIYTSYRQGSGYNVKEVSSYETKYAPEFSTTTDFRFSLNHLCQIARFYKV